jgi:hypothetical protein
MLIALWGSLGRGIMEINIVVAGLAASFHNNVNMFERTLLLSGSLLAPSKGFWIKYILSGSVVLLIMTGL